METRPASFEAKVALEAQHTTESLLEKAPSNLLLKPTKIINEAALPKIHKLTKEEELYKIYGGGKKPAKVRPLEVKGKDSKDRAARLQKL